MSDLINADAGAEIGPGVSALLSSLRDYIGRCPAGLPLELAARERYARQVLTHAARHPAIVAELTAGVTNLLTGTQSPPVAAPPTTAFAALAAEPEPAEPSSDDSEPGQ